MKLKTFKENSSQTIRAKRTERAFEQVMAQMAADPAIRAECAAITKDFRLAEADGLKQNCYED